MTMLAHKHILTMRRGKVVCHVAGIAQGLRRMGGGCSS